MNSPSGWIRGSLMAALVVGLLAAPEAFGGGKRGGGGGGRRAPRMSAPHRANRAPSFKAPSMPRVKAPSRANTNVARPNNNAQARANNASARANNNAIAHAARAQPSAANRVPGAPANSPTTRAAHAASSATPTTSLAGTSPNSYTYGSGSNARRYQARGYGRGYRNYYAGNRSGYGRSQGNNRAIVSRLRSVHSTLARLDHDYRGHRAQAMHHISMTIRQLSHRSMVSSGTGFNSGAGNIRMAGLNNRNVANNGLNGGVNNGRQRRRLSQAQSDARMGQALRTTQGIAMQMSNQGTGSASHARARGHLQYAMHEMNTALQVR